MTDKKEDTIGGELDDFKGRVFARVSNMERRLEGLENHTKPVDRANSMTAEDVRLRPPIPNNQWRFFEDSELGSKHDFPYVHPSQEKRYSIDFSRVRQAATTRLAQGQGRGQDQGQDV